MDSLAGRMPNMPLILAGPILRRVTDKSVTVWVALKHSANVALDIRSGDPGAGVKIGGATATTIAVGQYLHILAITAQVNLVPGTVYTYDMNFDLGADNPFGILVTLLKAITPPNSTPDPNLISLISYAPYVLPSFSLPPADPNSLRIIHGSCRMPHATGPDALSILDDLIRITVQNAAMRPHQLLLTGDQIYADDVGASLLMQLMDASKTLLGTDPAKPGWGAEETLPAGLPVGGPDYHTHKPSDFPPLTRTDLLGTSGAGFTSADCRSHLISLGEYLCMYLFTWSNVLWPNSAFLPTKAEVFAAAKAKNLDMNGDDKVDEDRDDVLVFLKTLPRVRRALANIPSYMMCDDHDVTDDWNMTPAFVNRVYDKDNGLGRRLVQNALVAYALCQLWGNTPEQFGFDASNKPAAGRKLLTAMNNTTSVGYDLSSAGLQTIVGLHTADQLKQQTPEGNFHDSNTSLTIGGVQVSADSLVYNFIYKGPAHEIIFTDTRTWRSYPHGEDATADLMPVNQILTQIPLATDTVDRILIVVLTTNAPPVQPIRGATRHDTLTTVFTKILQSDSHPDLFEAWEVPSLGFDRLLSRITDRLNPDPQDSSIKHYGQVVILSGDVHHSFATRLTYRAKNRFWDATPQPTRAAIAQLVASSFKKQDKKTVGFQRDGYFYVPFAPLKALLHTDITEGYVGWNVPQNITYNVGSFKVAVPRAGLVDVKIRPVTNTDPTIQVYPDKRPINLTTAPDYGYRLDYLVPTSQFLGKTIAAPIPPMPASGDPKAALQAFNAATGHYREHNLSAGNEKVIGRNNISELTFDWGPRDSQGNHKQVNHTVRWRYNGAHPGNVTPDPDLAGTYVVWTTYTVSLDPNDSNYDLTKAGITGL